MNKERRCYGLLVGVSRYEEERGDLPAAGRDVELMKTALTGGLTVNSVLGRQYPRFLEQNEGGRKGRRTLPE